jgi:hypothetical protein
MTARLYRHSADLGHLPIGAPLGHLRCSESSPNMAELYRLGHLRNPITYIGELREFDRKCPKILRMRLLEFWNPVFSGWWQYCRCAVANRGECFCMYPTMTAYAGDNFTYEICTKSCLSVPEMLLIARAIANSLTWGCNVRTWGNTQSLHPLTNEHVLIIAASLEVPAVCRFGSNELYITSNYFLTCAIALTLVSCIINEFCIA